MNDSKSEPGGIVAYIGILLDGVATVGQKWKKKVQEVIAQLHLPQSLNINIFEIFLRTTGPFKSTEFEILPFFRVLSDCYVSREVCH